MNRETQVIGRDMERLAHDAGTLLGAAADVAGEKVGEARKRLMDVVERGREVYGTVREKAFAGSKAVDVAVHENFYKTIAIGIGAGALLGYLFACRGACSRG